jgi:hypothetical protein
VVELDEVEGERKPEEQRAEERHIPLSRTSTATYKTRAMETKGRRHATSPHHHGLRHSLVSLHQETGVVVWGVVVEEAARVGTWGFSRETRYL